MGDEHNVGPTSLCQLSMQCLGNFIWVTLDSSKDEVLETHKLKRQLLKSMPYLPDDLKMRLFTHLLEHKQLNSDIVGALTASNELESRDQGWLLNLQFGRSGGWDASNTRFEGEN